MNYLILVNKTNLFEESMLGEIVLAGKDFNMKDVYLEKNTCEAVLKMLNDVNAIPGFNKSNFGFWLSFARVSTTCF